MVTPGAFTSRLVLVLFPLAFSPPSSIPTSPSAGPQVWIWDRVTRPPVGRIPSSCFSPFSSFFGCSVFELVSFLPTSNQGRISIGVPADPSVLLGLPDSSTSVGQGQPGPCQGGCGEEGHLHGWESLLLRAARSAARSPRRWHETTGCTECLFLLPHNPLLSPRFLELRLKGGQGSNSQLSLLI